MTLQIIANQMCTLTCLITEQGLISEQGGIFLQFNKRAGWNKRAVQGGIPIYLIFWSIFGISGKILLIKVSTETCFCCIFCQELWFWGKIWFRSGPNGLKTVFCAKKCIETREEEKNSQKLINEQGQIRASRVENSKKINKRACSSIRQLRVLTW